MESYCRNGVFFPADHLNCNQHAVTTGYALNHVLAVPVFVVEVEVENEYSYCTGPGDANIVQGNRMFVGVVAFDVVDNHDLGENSTLEVVGMDAGDIESEPHSKVEVEVLLDKACGDLL